MHKRLAILFLLLTLPLLTVAGPDDAGPPPVAIVFATATPVYLPMILR